MSKLRLWMVKKIFNHIEYLKEQIPYYENKLQTHLNSLTTDELYMFGVDTGYLDTKDYDAFCKKMEKRKVMKK